MREVTVYDKKIFQDERGFVAHFLRCDQKPFEEFGEVYFSCAYPGYIKGWHKHTVMDLNYVCISGNIQLVCYDEEKDIWYESFIGEKNYKLVHIPAGVWNAFRAIGGEKAIVANCSTLPHDPKEIIRIELEKIYYDWDNHI